MKHAFSPSLLIALLFPQLLAASSPHLSQLKSPILFQGDATTAYRDPAVFYDDGWFYLYFTKVVIEPDNKPYLYTAWSKSNDLRTWTPPKTFTPRDQRLNFSSPGNIIRHNNQYLLCLQTYPRPNGEMYGNKDSRLYVMRSDDLETWSPPELLRVKGPDVPFEKMGRMIDPFLLPDKLDPTKWWCLFKQNGVSLSFSHDLKNWTFVGSTPAGENACVLLVNNEYILSHSPPNGIGLRRSPDLKTWTDFAHLTLGQKDWPWAQGRLTAGFLLDATHIPNVAANYLLFFHASRYPESDPRGGFDNHASIALAWSNDLKTWSWPGK